MLDKSFGLLFYLKKRNNYVKGPIPIYLRITVDGSTKELSTKRACEPNRWNPSAERVSGTKEDAKALNAYLDTLQAKAYEAKRHLIEANEMVTAFAIKEILLGNSHRNRYLIQIFEDYNADVKKLIGKDYSKVTWEKYDRTKRFVKDFIQWKYKTGDIQIQNLNMEFVNDLEIWFKTERKCGQNATMKYISILKMIVLFCVDNDWLQKDPFARFKMSKEEVVPEFLTKEEIQAIL